MINSPNGTGNRAKRNQYKPYLVWIIILAAIVCLLEVSELSVVLWRELNLLNKENSTVQKSSINEFKNLTRQIEIIETRVNKLVVNFNARKNDVCIKGDQGERGDTGAIGHSGCPGHKGDKGSKGGTGNPGSKGDIGPIGPAGQPGRDGMKGENCNDTFRGFLTKGAPGFRGPPGAKGECFTIPGLDGEKGMDGFRGWQGMPGDKGEKGEKGDVTCKSKLYGRCGEKGSHL